MHGLILAELKKFVDVRLGGDAWKALLKDAGLGVKVYMPTQVYPDSDVTAIVGAASRTAGLPVATVLEQFGEFIVPDLLAVYGAYVKPEWKTLELILNTEETIHRVVRTRDPGALPPELKVTRSSAAEVVIEYTSARRLCAVARGIVKGVASHYRETISIAEPQCMLRGDAHCRISVKVLPSR